MKNACVVGYGAIGPVHAEALAACENANLYAVCDIDAARLQTCIDTYGIIGYNDFAQMLKDPKVEVVHICTPHYLHKEMAVKALLAGKDAVLEKPAAIDSAELAELRRAYAASGRKLCLMLQNRTNESIALLKHLIETDASLGNLTGIAAFMTWYRDEAYYNSAAWRGTWKYEGGGALINQAVHLIDLVAYLGGGIEKVRGSISTKLLDGCIEVEDTADALFHLKNGIRACFYAANTYTQNAPFHLELDFENARLRYADNRLYKITADAAKVLAADDIHAPGKIYWGSGHQNVINHFYHALEHGGAYIDFNDGLNTMEALFAVYESAKHGETEITI